MLPAIDPLISQSNPKFGALYRDLCSNKLDSDGTSKLDARTQKEQETVTEPTYEQELRKARVATARKSLVKSCLSSLAYRGSDLPDELQELLMIITATLENPPAGEEADLLQDDIRKFTINIPDIAPLVSKAFEQDLSSLIQIVSASDVSNPPDLVSWVDTTQQQIRTANNELQALRLSLTHQLSTINDLSLSASETSIRILEQTIHGSVSRACRAKADYLATVAEGMSKKLLLQHHRLLAATYSPELETAVAAKAKDLEREWNLLRRRAREAEERLEEFRRAGSMEGLAEEYAEIVREIGRVEGDVARLERKV